MDPFATRRLPASWDETAPDGSEVRVLLRLQGGSMAHFLLPPRRTSTAVRHRSVDEIWYILGGRGEMWRRQGAHESIVPLEAGVCLTIPRGTVFQFRTLGAEALTAVAVTMPSWPGADEAERVEGRWIPSEERSN